MTHISAFNDRSRGVLRDAYRSYPAQIRRELGLLDGKDRAAYSLSRLSDEVEWTDAKPGVDYDVEYLQSAGTADRMTIEIRRLEADEKLHQYAIGRPEAADEALTEIVRYDAFELHVAPSEVFDADAAAEVYYHYFQTNTVPEGMHLRELDFS